VARLPNTAYQDLRDRIGRLAAAARVCFGCLPLPGARKTGIFRCDLF